MTQSLVHVADVKKTYRLGHETVEALRGVTLDVQPGQFVAIMGASGSGKTTLLHLIGGLDIPDAGTIHVDGNDLSRMSDKQRTLFRRRRVGVVFQAYNLMPNLTARENVMLPLLIDGAPLRDISHRADELIARVRLEKRTLHRPDALSGGEQQRVAIARALMARPALLLADEPTGNLDPASARGIWALLRELAATTKTTIVMVTHEAAAAAQSDRTLVLDQGRFIGEIPSEGRGDAALVANRYAELAR